MTIKEATLKVMNEYCDVPTRQTFIVRKVQELTGYSYDSCRCNSFRNPNAIPELTKLFQKLKINNRVHYVKGKSKYKHNYIKPKEYFDMIKILNNSETIYSLGGTDCQGSKVLSNNTIYIDYSPLANERCIRKNIYSIKEKGSYNLDFEGRMTKKKLDYINSLPFEYLVLTIQSTKADYLIDDIKGNLLDSFEYIGKSNRRMKIYLFSNL